MTKRHALAVAIGLITSSTAVIATAEHGEVPEVKVQAEREGLSLQYNQDTGPLQGADSAELLNRLPGAAVNSNGPLSGIAQYRGTYGDRVSVHIDGAHFVGGGPNAMDTPLSYAPGTLLKELSLTRGIAPVSITQESFGGHMHASLQRGEFGQGDQFKSGAQLDSRYSSHNQGSSTSALYYTSNQHHKLGASVSYDHGNDAKFVDSDKVKNSFYERDRFDLFYGFQSNNTGFNLNLAKNNTGDSGTAALPMDITSIDTDLVSADFYTQIGDSRLFVTLSYNDVDHTMDNFSHRTAPTMMMGSMPMAMPMNRLNTADGRNLSYKIQLNTPLANGELRLGLDSSNSEHNALITDPTNAMFSVENFNNSQRRILGGFVEWQLQSGQWLLETGVRHNRVSSDSDVVAFTGMMGMMGSNASQLADAFNDADRSRSDNNLDLVAKLAYQLDRHTTLSMGLAQKNRAPSYQERYLWLPLQATGGLADGRNYIGNLALDSEKAHELNLGIDWQTADTYFSVQAFYRDVDDYIQGTAVTDMSLAMAANMVSNMMPGNQDALQFNNVEAKLYGADMAYGKRLSDHWRLDGNLSYVRGKRKDVADDLYRIAPLNHRVTLTYSADNYQLSLESELFAQQNHVAEVNGEIRSDGYGLIHLRGQWQINPSLKLLAGINNLFDKAHANHLAGINRVADSDIAQGDRINGSGRSLVAGFNYRW